MSINRDLDPTGEPELRLKKQIYMFAPSVLPPVDWLSGQYCNSVLRELGLVRGNKILRLYNHEVQFSCQAFRPKEIYEFDFLWSHIEFIGIKKDLTRSFCLAVLTSVGLLSWVPFRWCYNVVTILFFSYWNPFPVPSLKYICGKPSPRNFGGASKSSRVRFECCVNAYFFWRDIVHIEILDLDTGLCGGVKPNKKEST